MLLTASQMLNLSVKRHDDKGPLSSMVRSKTSKTFYYLSTCLQQRANGTADLPAHRFSLKCSSYERPVIATS